MTSGLSTEERTCRKKHKYFLAIFGFYRDRLKFLLCQRYISAFVCFRCAINSLNTILWMSSRYNVMTKCPESKIFLVFLKHDICLCMLRQTKFLEGNNLFTLSSLPGFYGSVLLESAVITE